MQAEDYFRLGIRLFGVLVLYWSLQMLLDSGLFHLGYFRVQDSSAGYYLICGIAEVIGAVYLIYGAPLLVRFAYPQVDEEDEEQSA